MAEEEKKSTPIRWLWVIVGAVIMGGIAIGVAWAATHFNLLSELGIEDPQLGFWAFQGMCGVGYLVGGLVVAICSPGETITEPIIAAVAAFAVQTVVLLVMGWIELGPKTFIAIAAIDGGFAYGGAWFGELVSGGLKKKKEA